MILRPIHLWTMRMIYQTLNIWTRVTLIIKRLRTGCRSSSPVVKDKKSKIDKSTWKTQTYWNNPHITIWILNNSQITCYTYTLNVIWFIHWVTILHLIWVMYIYLLNIKVALWVHWGWSQVLCSTLQRTHNHS